VARRADAAGNERTQTVKRSLRTLVVVLLGLVLVTAACGKDDNNASSTTTTSSGAPASADEKITIGAQDFGESAILAEIYKQGLVAKGYSPTIQKLGGFRPVELTAFGTGTINFAPEYAASMLEALNDKKGEATGDVDATLAKLAGYLTAKKLKALESSDAVDTNAFVVTKATADKYGLKTLSDLAAKGKDLKLGGPSDCETNPFCLPGLKKTYGVDLSKKYQALETGQVADALDAGTIDIALLFSTDGRIAAKNYVLLEDDKHMLAADNVVPVVTTDLAAYADIVDATNAITAKIHTADLIAMNKRFDIDKEDAAVIAKDFLTKAGLL
jgi:osmoprotectant transport system substrate-binding protein